MAHHAPQDPKRFHDKSRWWLVMPVAAKRRRALMHRNERGAGGEVPNYAASSDLRSVCEIQGLLL